MVIVNAKVRAIVTTREHKIKSLFLLSIDRFKKATNIQKVSKSVSKIDSITGKLNVLISQPFDRLEHFKRCDL